METQRKTESIDDIYFQTWHKQHFCNPLQRHKARREQHLTDLLLMLLNTNHTFWASYPGICVNNKKNLLSRYLFPWHNNRVSTFTFKNVK